VTAALVAGGMWLVDGRKQGGETLANGATAVSIPGKSTVPPPKVGSPAQDFTVTTIDGQKVSLSQFKGKPVWVVFGASWCAPCQAEVPDIEAAYKQYGPKGLVILGVNITEDTETVRAYAKRVGITFPVAADPESAVADAYRVSAIPAHFFVDKNGVLKEIRQGSVSETSIAASMKGLITP
jgi:peroxiredoxin